MKRTGTLVAALAWVALTAPSSHAQSEAADAVQHIQRACESVWSNAPDYQIARCTRRAMAALGEDDGLRDNELKRHLIHSEHELETCTEELERVRAELSKAGESASRTARRKP